MKIPRQTIVRAASVTVCVFALAVAAGCNGVRRYPPPRFPDSAFHVEPDTDGAIRRIGATDSASRDLLRRPRNLLVLSGGGANGTYTAGVLAGWTESGSRPEFDVVTGISIGAIIAPFAFLGSQYDDVLVHNTNMRGRDIYRRRRLPALIWSDSFADSGPLQRRIDALITDELLAEIAAAHRTGRRLYVGTTNLDTKRQVVWDLGAIAAGNDPKRLDLFRKILLASAAIPALLPTVPIDIFVNGRRHTELHIDGGAAASLFLHRDMLQPDRATEPVTEQNVFVIVAKGLQQPNEPVERTLSRVAGESLSGVLHAQMEGDLRKVFSLARDSGARVHLAAIPSGFEKNSDSMAFDRKLMRQLFDEGFHSAATGECWQSRLPVDIEQEASPRPRRGVQFQLRESPPVDLKRGKG